MDGIPEITKSPERESSMAVLPPPTEVKIRTMKSDVAALAASGGGLPRFQSVKVAGLSIEKGIDSPEAVHKNNAIVAIVITAIALVVLGTLGYFAYRILSGGTI